MVYQSNGKYINLTRKGLTQCTFPNECDFNHHATLSWHGTQIPIDIIHVCQKRKREGEAEGEGERER